MGVELYEIACNWRTVAHFKGAKCLQPIDLQMCGPICEKVTSVLLDIPNKPDLDLVALRNWLESLRRANHPQSFKMFNRFQLEEHRYRTERRFLGTNFRFSDQNMAATFKIFWV